MIIRKFPPTLCLLLLILLFGCANNKSIQSSTYNPKPESYKIFDIKPEPYKKALQQINNMDYDMALKYLDLTITDFPNSKYVNNSYILESIIYNGKTMANRILIQSLMAGVQQGAEYYNSEERQLINKYFATLQSELNKLEDESRRSIIFVAEKLNTNQLDFNDVSIKLVQPSPKTSLDFFKSVGYPVPTEYEFNSIKNEYEQEAINYMLNNAIKSGEINLPQYYYDIATLSYYFDYDNELTLKLCNKVLQLTEKDKYNEVRLQVEDFIKEIKRK
ncbi:hypothetical protein [Desulfofundulus thermocisternus]|uniref:hypothetical protein n=1 Tax=Desulfofundulus thermocisternus TaxID=42471 RepID=UPI000489C15A|nr:hypothetical protein [Desulfofundulus thermocisternus]